MAAPVDPNEPLMTGENSFIRLSEDGGKSMSDRISHWRVLWCPAGAGHVLFMQTKLLNGQVRIYSDNPGVARWLQRTIEKLLFPAFADEKTPIIAAEFARGGDPRGTAWETIVAGQDRVRLTWWDTLPPFVLSMPPGMNDRPIGVFSTFFPARAAQIEMNGFVATGQPWAEMRGDRQSSSACLAWSETWVKPRG
ncbi:MAG: hypothetical protein HY216_06435 [Candidatus Rokubacteria bacterium]|nr:hypothetical protein [Candidatus Rokubacteria bacterium]